MVIRRTCAMCGEAKPVGAFYYPTQSYCRRCQNIYPAFRNALRGVGRIIPWADMLREYRTVLRLGNGLQLPEGALGRWIAKDWRKHSQLARFPGVLPWRPRHHRRV